MITRAITQPITPAIRSPFGRVVANLAPPPVPVDPLQALIDSAFGLGQRGYLRVNKPVVLGSQVLFQDAGFTVPVQFDGDPVGGRLDIGPNGLHDKQPVSAARPVYRTDGTRHWLDYSGNKWLYTEATVALPDNANGLLIVQASRDLVKTNQYNVSSGRRVFSVGLSSTTDYSFSVQRPETYSGDYIVNIGANTADHIFAARWLGQGNPSQGRFNRETWFSAPIATPSVGTVNEPIESGSYRALEGTATSFSNGRQYAELCTSRYSDELLNQAEELFQDYAEVAL